jgi:predicted ATPase
MEDLRIRRLMLTEVGVFKHLNLSFPECPVKDKAEIHIFTGENGTGKTTLLEAMTAIELRFRQYNKHRTIAKMSQQSSIDIGFQGASFIISKPNLRFHFNRAFRPISMEKKNPVVMRLRDFFVEEELRETPELFYGFFAYNGFRRFQNDSNGSSDLVPTNPLDEAIHFEKNEPQTNLFEWIKDNKTRAALAFQSGNIPSSKKYLAQIEKVELAVGEIIDRKIQFVINERSLQVRVLLDDQPIALESLPDGYQSIISWLADLVFRLDDLPQEGRENFTLFLDEIDVHLHPKAQRRILPVIQKLFPKAQIFLTTHSPFIIGSVDDAWVYKFKLDEDGNSVLDGEPRLSEDAQSYRSILEEVFDIREQFGIGAEAQLDGFYALRKETLSNPNETNWAALNRLGDALAKQSIEMAHLVKFELRQAGRILHKDVTI